MSYVFGVFQNSPHRLFVLSANETIETTVVSFYFNARPEPEMIARQNWTRRWLDAAMQSLNQIVTSLAVETELNAGEFPNKADMLQMASRFPLLDVNDAVIEAVVTWNCRHIANANKFGHIRRVNGILGLGNPALVTPLELLNEETCDG